MTEAELIRHKKLIALKQELIEMLDGTKPDSVQKAILENIEMRIQENSEIQRAK